MPRFAVLAAVSYVGVVVLANVAAFVLVGAGRLIGDDPRGGDLAAVANLRRVDSKVWAGAQPDSAAFRAMADKGVSLVVDLRTGASDDPHVDDPAFLGALGVDHAQLPVPDGHTPGPEAVRRFVTLVDDSEGLVYLHCGGGVGRSVAMQAAYLAATRGGPRWWDLMAVGPVTLEQAWFTAQVSSDRPAPEHAAIRRISELLDAPRRGLSRLRGLL